MNLDGNLENFDDMASNFDDSETFQNFKGQQGAAPTAKRSASFDLVMSNPSAENLNFELFNFLSSFTIKRQLNLVNSATVLLHPLNSFEGSLLAGSGIVGFRENGQLILTGAAAAVALTVDCPQFGYQGLLESSAKQAFTIKAIRMTTVTDGQIDNSIVHFKNTFLGAKQENTINPRTSFRPDQFQNKIIDIPCNFAIDAERGLRYTLNAGEVVKWNVIIER